MVSGIISTLIEIERGGNSTAAQYLLALERTTDLYFAGFFTCILLAIFACCGQRLSV